MHLTTRQRKDPQIAPTPTTTQRPTHNHTTTPTPTPTPTPFTLHLRSRAAQPNSSLLDVRVVVHQWEHSERNLLRPGRGVGGRTPIQRPPTKSYAHIHAQQAELQLDSQEAGSTTRGDKSTASSKRSHQSTYARYKTPYGSSPPLGSCTVMVSLRKPVMDLTPHHVHTYTHEHTYTHAHTYTHIHTHTTQRTLIIAPTYKQWLVTRRTAISSPPYPPPPTPTPSGTRRMLQ